MRALLVLLARDLSLLLPGGRRGGALLPVLFFLAVAILYPFALGPEPALLRRTGGGGVWIAALLASILPLERLFAADVERGLFDQWTLRGIAEESVAAVRLVAHWLSFGPLLMLAAPPAAALLGLQRTALQTVELGLLAGTPGLAAIGVMIGALTVGLRGSAGLAGLLVIPLAVPLLIFGAGALAANDNGALAVTAAISIVLVVLAPFAAGAALRAARER